MSSEIADSELRLEDEMPPTPVDPARRGDSPFPAKNYIPATPVNANSPKPFGSQIDAPLG
jgi:hypothetical protein